jgi:hypothetical protein
MPDSFDVHRVDLDAVADVARQHDRQPAAQMLAELGQSA